MDFGPLFVIGVLTLVGVGFGLRNLQRRANILDTWRKVAGEFGFELTSDTVDTINENPKMHGEYRGVEVSVLTTQAPDLDSGSLAMSFGNAMNAEAMGFDDDSMPKNAATTYEVVLDDSLPPHLALRREGFLAKFDKMAGAIDIQVDDKEVDKQFIVEGVDDDFIAALLTEPSAKEALLAAWDRFPDLRLEDGSLLRTKKARELDGNELRATIDAMVDVAVALNEAAPRVRERLDAEHVRRRQERLASTSD